MEELVDLIFELVDVLFEFKFNVALAILVIIGIGYLAVTYL